MLNNDDDFENFGIALGKCITRILDGIDRLDGQFPVKLGKDTIIVEYSAYRMMNFIRIDIKRIPLPVRVSP